MILSLFKPKYKWRDTINEKKKCACASVCVLGGGLFILSTYICTTRGKASQMLICMVMSYVSTYNTEWTQEEYRQMKELLPFPPSSVLLSTALLALSQDGKNCGQTQWSETHRWGHVLQVVRLLCLKDKQPWTVFLFSFLGRVWPKGKPATIIQVAGWWVSGLAPQTWSINPSIKEKEAAGFTWDLTLSQHPTQLFSENPQNRRFAHNQVVICFIFHCCSEYIDSGLRTSRVRGMSDRSQAPRTYPNC